jgi:homoserine dehydrogenase
MSGATGTRVGEFAPVPAAAPAARTVRVALAGCGVVGGNLLRLIADQRTSMQREHAVRLEVVRVLVRDPAKARATPLLAERFTADPAELLASAPDVVVEAMGGAEPALSLARRTLARGGAFVTANKQLIAAHGAELAGLARRHGGRLDFEAAVGGGIPILRVLRDSLPPDGVTAVRGILNGTTNFLLCALEGGVTFADALAEARRLGFAEADPGRDLSGRDAADKLRILAWLAFGAEPARISVHTRGVLPDPARYSADAAALGGVTRLVAECALTTRGPVASVEPWVVAPGSELGAVSRERNLVSLTTRESGDLALAGPGAGGAPTASVLLADVLHGAGRLPVRSDAFAAAVDARELKWLLSVPRSPSLPRLLPAVLRRARVAPERLELDGADGVARLLLRPTTRARAEALASLLSSDEAPVCLSRVANL